MALTAPTPLAGRSASSSASSSSRSLEPAVLTPAALEEWLSACALPLYRWRQILCWVYRRGAGSFAEMSDLPRDLRAALAEVFVLPRLVPACVARSADDTRKLLFGLEEGRAIESVLIPDPPRLTLCISSQAGCAMGCRFCATARLGFQRNLTASEIVGQVLAAAAELAAGERITNIVFMGMGEPLHNYDNVLAAIAILCADWGLGFSSRRITVSTAGLLPELERLVRESPVNIAISLSATSNSLRDRLMPVNRKYRLEQLIAACRSLPIPQRRRITFEYVMLAGVNDSPADAARLVRLLHGVRCKINLIPFNTFPGAGFESSAPSAVRQFQERLLASGLNATVRASRGRDIQAACGQLAGERRQAG